MCPTKCFIVVSRTDTFCPEKSDGQLYLRESDADAAAKALNDSMLGITSFSVVPCIIMPEKTFYELCPGWSDSEEPEELINAAMYPSSDDLLNVFTKELVRRCRAVESGPVCVELRNGEVAAVLEDVRDDEDDIVVDLDADQHHGFVTESHEYSWYANGRSLKNCDLDIVSFV